MLLLLSLTIFISSGSFDLESYLNDRFLKQGTDLAISDDEVELARTLNITAAHDYDYNNEAIGSKQWITSTTNLAKSSSIAAIELARYYYLKSDEVDVQSVSHKYNRAAVQWFSEAIAMGNEQATVELAYLYLDAGALESTAKVISELEMTAENVGIFLTLAIAVGDYQKIVAIKESFAFEQARNSTANDDNNVTLRTSLSASTTNPNSSRFNQLLGSIERFYIFEQSEAIVQSAAESKVNSSKVKNRTPLRAGEQPPLHCKNSFQLLASSLKNLARAEVIIEEIKGSKVGKQFCFEQPKYLPIQAMKCSSNKQQAIECEEEGLALVAPVINSRYIGLITEQGVANVHYGAMYLDKNDSSDVLKHELSHLLGFVDEYPLRAGHEACSMPKNKLRKSIANNVSLIDVEFLSETEKSRASVNSGKETLKLREHLLKEIPWRELIKPTTPIFYFKQQKLQLGTPKSHVHEVGLYITRTCELSKVRAFKPVAHKTLLEHNEMSFPAVYEALLEIKGEQNRYRMPSFHYNIALAKFKKGDEKAARYWLTLAAGMETDTVRKQSIKKGAF